ncbi:hypothetical protein Isop_1274 [Isosphaera pallida ATCC 43644]|jgi:hypothetical protein|uniref:Uncharacterized protein n=1 Tax=Isosphaera pallida (strain ATCC 43644 / DSM 9630 / IS1B) TaxID=575540 RepID=E8R6F9_ISOPI|nr:hypothetical protein [Isosphaera pallida]ADV61860.1 hypothetical protein Isop_1274 [Isosphaera pallida ATCC 43644]
MSEDQDPRIPSDYHDQLVVLDLSSPYVCLGRLHQVGPLFVEVRDADLHDLRDSTTTRELYVVEAVRYGIRRNRERVLIRCDEVVAITRLSDFVDA